MPTDAPTGYRKGAQESRIIHEIEITTAIQLVTEPEESQALESRLSQQLKL